MHLYRNVIIGKGSDRSRRAGTYYDRSSYPEICDQVDNHENNTSVALRDIDNRGGTYTPPPYTVQLAGYFKKKIV